MSDSIEKVSATNEPISERESGRSGSPISNAIQKASKKVKSHTHVSKFNELDTFLNESLQVANQVKQPWNKLKKQERIDLLREYAMRYLEENDIPHERKLELQDYLVSAMDKKRLSNVKEIVYDKEKQIIHSIPILMYCSAKRKFTLKRVDKRQSVLKSLTPKKGKSVTKSSRSEVAGNKHMISDNTSLGVDDTDDHENA